MVTVASGIPRHRGETAITLGNRYAAFHVARLDPGRAVLVPEAPFGHIFLARGSVVFEGTADGQATLSAGDAVRTTSTGGHRITAVTPSEVLIWEMHASTN
ncbi:hypothetical protein IRT45_29705 [Nocardia sp. BSTN01]|uniref:hypothetical protein n=1 Tax=Nocardia sp. BSTN01 TaxID=2783665 RepID=UPI0018904A38|nr:hypothetical protein [Nocardia sp. BSTN01]MBF5001311.1 hypothetical protein [Nocardia sp. BSTN01]